VVTRDVEELPRRTRHAVSELVDEGGAGRDVLKHRDGVVVGRAGKLSAVLGGAPNLLVQAFSRLFLAIAQLPLLAGGARTCLGSSRRRLCAGWSSS
jgi:hypothetical protein